MSKSLKKRKQLALSKTNNKFGQTLIKKIKKRRWAKNSYFMAGNNQEMKQDT